MHFRFSIDTLVLDRSHNNRSSPINLDPMYCLFYIFSTHCVRYVEVLMGFMMLIVGAFVYRITPSEGDMTVVLTCLIYKWEQISITRQWFSWTELVHTLKIWFMTCVLWENPCVVSRSVPLLMLHFFLLNSNLNILKTFFFALYSNTCNLLW